MKLTPKALVAGEKAIFRALECNPKDTTFRGKLYRDGVPKPHDMCDEVQDERFRPLRDGIRQSRWSFHDANR